MAGGTQGSVRWAGVALALVLAWFPPAGAAEVEILLVDGLWLRGELLGDDGAALRVRRAGAVVTVRWDTIAEVHVGADGAGPTPPTPPRPAAGAPAEPSPPAVGGLVAGPSPWGVPAPPAGGLAAGPSPWGVPAPPATGHDSAAPAAGHDPEAPAPAGNRVRLRLVDRVGLGISRDRARTTPELLTEWDRQPFTAELVGLGRLRSGELAWLLGDRRLAAAVERSQQLAASHVVVGAGLLGFASALANNGLAQLDAVRTHDGRLDDTVAPASLMGVAGGFALGGAITLGVGLHLDRRVRRGDLSLAIGRARALGLVEAWHERHPDGSVLEAALREGSVFSPGRPLGTRPAR